MKISIKDVICNIKNINNTLYISDADCNAVIYPKTKRASRGKNMSKEKLADLDIENQLKINGSLHFPLNTEHIDNCLGNQKIDF